MTYIIKTDGKFIHFTGLGFISAHESLAKASFFKTLKDAQSKAQAFYVDASKSIEYYTNLIDLTNQKISKVENDLAKARSRLANLKTQPMERVEAQASKLKKTISRLEGLMEDLRKLASDSNQALRKNKNKSVTRPVVMKVVLQAA